MAVVLKGKHKGKSVNIHQWCNDWFMVDVADDQPAILSPTQLRLTEEEAKKITPGNSGMLLKLFQLISIGNGDYVFKRTKG
jgi:hypothetical protein